MNRSLCLNNNNQNSLKKKDEDSDAEVQMNKLVDNVIQNCKLNTIKDSSITTTQKIQQENTKLITQMQTLNTAPVSPRRNKQDSILSFGLQSINETFSSSEFNYSQQISILEQKNTTKVKAVKPYRDFVKEKLKKMETKKSGDNTANNSNRKVTTRYSNVQRQ